MNIQTMGITTLLLIMGLMSSASTEPTEAVIFGDSVRVRKTPNLKAAVVTTLNTGTVVTVIETSRESGSIDQGCAAPWLRVAAPDACTGWIFGRFVYPLTTSEFLVPMTAASILEQRLTLDGRAYRFAMAAEPPSPNPEQCGFTRHGLPCFTGEPDRQVMLIRVPKTIAVKYRDDEKGDYWFRLRRDDFMGETILSVTTVKSGGRDAVAIEVDYNTQTGGGRYRLVMLPTGDRFTVTEYRLMNETK